ncbi:MAG: acylphosphatase [Lachnospiraceae bacterium]|nr:acylphosphatase [Lachnospiraceae bacterium]MDE6253243.1 acylphosphatase [Lachnospiraceae bacterium]
MSEILRKHILFYGHVQGVGFRYHAKHGADMLGLSGWVRNLYDGSVEMEVQGREEDIDKLIVLLQQGKYIDITDMKVKNKELENDISFRIR